MAGLDPAIHVVGLAPPLPAALMRKRVDARIKSGHDDDRSGFH